MSENPPPSVNALSTPEGQTTDVPVAPAAAPVQPPALEVFVDIPNFEQALRGAKLPSALYYTKLGTKLKWTVPGFPYYLKRIWCFASVRQFDPVTGEGEVANDAYSAHLRRIIKSETGLAQLVLSHRLPPRTAGYSWEEKGVDTNLAATMMEGACDNRYDVALLLSNDSDYAGVCRRVVARGKRVIYGYVGAPGGENPYLSAVASEVWTFDPALATQCKAS
jgi:uncharacterized LabA/DUF88 family protein